MLSSVGELLVEIHVPLIPSEVPEGEYRFPWIDSVMEFLVESDGSQGEMYDDGAELGEEYVFFVYGASESDLISLGRRVSQLPGVPRVCTPRSRTPMQTWAAVRGSTSTDGDG